MDTKRQTSGIICDNISKARRDYHYAIRYIKRQESHIRKHNFLNSLLYDKHDFFAEVKRFKGQKSVPTESLNGNHTREGIAETFASELQFLSI